MIEHKLSSEQNFNCPFKHTSMTSMNTCRKLELVHSIKVTFLHAFLYLDILFRYRLAPYMIENITKRGYQRPTPIQMQAIPLMIHVSTCQTSLVLRQS